jgi:hypothetical protein
MYLNSKALVACNTMVKSEAVDLGAVSQSKKMLVNKVVKENWNSNWIMGSGRGDLGLADQKTLCYNYVTKM